MNVKVAFLPMLIILLVVVIPLLVLFIKLCIKRPGLAAIFTLIPIICIVSIVLYARSVRRQEISAVEYPNTIQSQSPQSITQNDRGLQVQAFQDVMQSYMSPHDQSSSSSQSPIWSEGIENEFEADVYPSKTAAIRSIALKIGKQFRNIMDSLEMPETIVIIRNSQELELVEQLRDAITKRYPEVRCRIVEETLIFNVNEAYIKFYSVKNDTTRVFQDFRNTLQSGTFQATFSNQDRSTIISVNYVEQPWVEDFASFANSQPGKHYIIAKSNEICLTPEEANRQAMQNACTQVGTLLLSRQNPNKLDYNKIFDSGIVADKFAQSFDGSAGKIWRQAILLDASSQKLNHLASIISGATRARSMNWARTILSVLGLFVLITIVYLFLNAATRGYYTWSLRIVGIILAAIFLFIILLLSRGGPGMGGL